MLCKISPPSSVNLMGISSLPLDDDTEVFCSVRNGCARCAAYNVYDCSSSMFIVHPDACAKKTYKKISGSCQCVH